MAGYTSPRILEIVRNCDIDFRHFYVAPGQGPNESPDQMNSRYLRGAPGTGSRKWDFVLTCSEPHYAGSSEFGLIAFLNPRIPSAKPFPSSGSFFGPNRNNATARITNRCRGWSMPSIIYFPLIGEDRA